MKQLIMTFFVVILCYSLFFDKKAENPAIDEINSIQDDAQISDFPHIAPYTMHFITLYNYPSDWNAASKIYVLNKPYNKTALTFPAIPPVQRTIEN